MDNPVHFGDPNVPIPLAKPRRDSRYLSHPHIYDILWWCYLYDYRS